MSKQAGISTFFKKAAVAASATANAIDVDAADLPASATASTTISTCAVSGGVANSPSPPSVQAPASAASTATLTMPTATASATTAAAAAGKIASAAVSAAANKKRTAAEVASVGADASNAASPPSSKQPKTTAKAIKAGAASASATASATSSLTSKEVDAFKAQLVKNVLKSIKKTGHGNRNAPWTTVTEGVASKALAVAALGDLGGNVTSSSANSERREVRGHNRITQWLGLTENHGLIHPVKFSGTTLVPVGQSVSVYAWAAIEQMVVTIKPNLLTLKIRTWMCASGRPGFAKLAPIDDESSDRICKCGGVDDIEKYVTAALLASGMGPKLALLKE